MTQIDQAKKKKDLEGLNKITHEIQNRGGTNPLFIYKYDWN